MIELPRAWYTAGGNNQLWGDHGTYHRIDAALLPPVGPLDGSLSWLAAPHPKIKPEQLTRLEGASTIGNELRARAVEAASLGLTLPLELTAFLTSKRPGQIPTATACYFDLGTRLVELPDHTGPERLLRFLNDQQTSVLWYVLLAPAGHEVVCGSPDWFDDDEDLELQEEEEDMSLDDAMRPTELEVCAGSFEEFLKRFWIENTLWFAVHEGHPPIEGELKTYLDAVAKNRR